MQNSKIIPEKITSPFQLMAAWFVMLVLLVSILLAASIKIEKPHWASGFLVIFTSFLIVLVLLCVTLMLTIFRPNLQDGKEYAQWLKDKNNYSHGIILDNKEQNMEIQNNNHINYEEDNDKSFLIQVSNIPGAHRLIKKFAKSGFRAHIYNVDYTKDPDMQEAIWIGYKLPAKEVIQSIKIAVSEWSNLKYLHLSNDDSGPDEIHYEMYFGGATSTAENYGLSKWSKEELMNLNENLSQIEFHRKVRSKYP